MNRTEFNEALTSLIEYAAANAGHVTTDDIRLYFGSFFTDESQYDAVYSYLKESKVTIDDLKDFDKIEVPSNDSSPYDDVNVEEDVNVKTINKPLESEEELSFVQMYEDEIKVFSNLSLNEKMELLEAVKKGDSLATSKVTESYLPFVHKIAKSYAGQGVTLGDLIQEGNIGLLLAVPEFDGQADDFDDYVEAKIREGIEEAISIQTHSDRISDHLAGRMNSLDDISKSLTEKLGRAPSISELADEMHITEEEVDTIIRTSLNVLTINESSNGNDDK